MLVTKDKEQGASGHEMALRATTCEFVPLSRRHLKDSTAMRTVIRK